MTGFLQRLPARTTTTTTTTTTSSDDTNDDDFQDANPDKSVDAQMADDDQNDGNTAPTHIPQGLLSLLVARGPNNHIR